jgi:carbonic anhydrase
MGALEDNTQITEPFVHPYAECNLGVHQSPVELFAAAPSGRLNRLRFNYKDDTPDFFNSGHAVQVNTSSGYLGGIYVGMEFYPLVQFHFHSPGEHLINGISLPG